MTTTETTTGAITWIGSDGEVWRGEGAGRECVADWQDALPGLRPVLTPAEYAALRAHRALLRAEGYPGKFKHYGRIEGEAVVLGTDGWYLVTPGEEADALLREARILGARIVRDDDYDSGEDGDDRYDQYVVRLDAGDLDGARANRRALATGLRRFYRVEHG